MTLPPLALGTLTQRSGYAQGAWAALFLLPWVLARFWQTVTDQPYLALMSLPTCIKLVGQFIFGLERSHDVTIRRPTGIYPLVRRCIGYGVDYPLAPSRGSPMSAPLVETNKLCKWYGRIVGINDFTVSIKPGVTGLLDPTVRQVNLHQTLGWRVASLKGHAPCARTTGLGAIANYSLKSDTAPITTESTTTCRLPSLWWPWRVSQALAPRTRTNAPCRC